MSKFMWVCALAIVFSGTTIAQAQQSDDQATIRKAIQSYVAAFNGRDAKALAAHWSPEGVYVSRLNGDRLTGREELEAEFTALFEEEKETRLEVATESIEFISPNVALELGSAIVMRPKAPPAKSDYRVVYIKQDGKWLIDRVTEEEELPKAPSHYEQLKDLEWMIGDWVDQAGEITIKTECQWTRSKNFITRSFTVSAEGQIDMAGMQLVGWDPAEKVFRSWLFDSEGGFVEGIWKHVGDHWIVRSSATLSDGKKGSFTSVFRPIDENSFGWKKVSRIVDGEILPNIDEVIIVRSGSQQ